MALASTLLGSDVVHAINSNKSNNVDGGKLAEQRTQGVGSIPSGGELFSRPLSLPLSSSFLQIRTQYSFPHALIRFIVCWLAVFLINVENRAPRHPFFPFKTTIFQQSMSGEP